MIELVQDASVDHDIGGYGFSQIESTEVGESTAREELCAMVNAANEWDTDIDSFVYPMNSVAHDQLLPELGIKAYRRYFTNESKLPATVTAE